ncbi:MAG: VacJ family lipoprotein, partial [Novosphingobium sp.]|nr:VacJ family lipoprotein [Novosphingobium sp.]
MSAATFILVLTFSAATADPDIPAPVHLAVPAAVIDNGNAEDTALHAPARQDFSQAVMGEGADHAPQAVNETAGEQDRKDIIVEAQIGPPPGDPLESVNVQTFEVVQAIDKALVEPVARGYIAAFPKPVRNGIHNVVTNLDEPIVFLSFLLQMKPVQAFKTLG